MDVSHQVNDGLAFPILFNFWNVYRLCSAVMLHGRNNRFFFLWEKLFFLRQNIFIVPAMQTSIDSVSGLLVSEFILVRVGK